MDDRELTELLAQQTRYYRARAATYDLDMAWDSDDPDLRALFAPVEAWFSGLPVRGRVLELACGTGTTRRLAGRADHVHALDVAPEMVERAAARVADVGRVSFEVADVHRWRPAATYDLVFFSFLLTHLPPPLGGRFWATVAAALADGGTVAFVDAAPHRHGEEEWLGEGVVRRTLRDGSVHRIVKVFPTAAEIARSMTGAGLDARVEPLGGAFLAGTGRPTRSVG